MIKTITGKSGTTLAEILIYFTVFSVFTLVAITFAIQISNVTTVSRAMEEMQENQEFISEKISQSIKGASSINTGNSVLDSGTGKLYMEMRDTEVSPTQIYIEDNKIYLKEAADEPIQLNTNDIKINSLTFHQISYEKTPDQITTTIEISPISQDLAAYKQDLTINLTTSLR